MKTKILLTLFLASSGLQSLVAQDNTLWLSTTLGDKVSLYDNRIGSQYMYGFGVESQALYYKTYTYHRWYCGTNADEGTSEQMNLSSARLIIEPKVGIGTDSPDYKLDVNGTVRAKEVIVETGWSDFVFDDSYNLRSLSEVESHIEEYGHLPDVPSAAVVESEGLSVGEAQRIMMQKIEELTLYVIEQDKRNAALRAEVQAQREEIERLKSN